VKASGGDPTNMSSGPTPEHLGGIAIGNDHQIAVKCIVALGAPVEPEVKPSSATSSGRS
jgi:hypothetical protein